MESHKIRRSSRKNILIIKNLQLSWEFLLGVMQTVQSTGFSPNFRPDPGFGQLGRLQLAPPPGHLDIGLAEGRRDVSLLRVRFPDES